MKFDEFLRNAIPKEIKELIELITDAEEKLNIDLIPPEWRRFVRVLKGSETKVAPVTIDELSYDYTETDFGLGEDEEPVARPLKTYPDFLEQLFRKPAGVHLIIGKIGSGKTALSLRLAEVFRDYTGNSVYVMNMPTYPDWVDDEVAELKGVKFGSRVDVNFVTLDGRVLDGNNSILIIDDASTLFDSWSRGEQNRYLKYLMFIARHKNCAVIVNSQESASINKYIEGQARSIWIKEPSIMFEETERKLIAKLVREAKEYFDRVPAELRNQYAYVVTPDGKAFMKITLPRGWSEDISTNKRNFL
jgi:energy-coupling factor transporter ATP-binding protein EcfA2